MPEPIRPIGDFTHSAEEHMAGVTSMSTPVAVDSEQTDSARRKEFVDFLMNVIYNDNVDLGSLQPALCVGSNPQHGVAEPLPQPTTPIGPSIQFEDNGYRVKPATAADFEPKTHISQQPKVVQATVGGRHRHPLRCSETRMGKEALLREAEHQQEQKQLHSPVPNKSKPWNDYLSLHRVRQDGNIGGTADHPLQCSMLGYRYATNHPLSPESAQDMLQPNNKGSADDFLTQGGVPKFLMAVSPSPSTPNHFYTQMPGLTCDPVPFLDFEMGSWDSLEYESSSPIQPQTASPASVSPSSSAGGLVVLTTSDHALNDTQPGTGELSSPPPSGKPQGRSHQQATARPHRPHSVVEKRYRAGINEKIEALRGCLESRKRQKGRLLHEALLNGVSLTDSDKNGKLQHRNGGEGGHHDHFSTSSSKGDHDVSGSNNGSSITDSATTIPTRMNKAEVLIEAVEYIQQLEEENQIMMDQLRQLVVRLCAARQALLPSTTPDASCDADSINSTDYRLQQAY